LKVIEVGTNRKPVCEFLLVINSHWHPNSYRFGHCVFEPSFRGSGTTYDVHLGITEKHFLFVVIELFR